MMMMGEGVSVPSWSHSHHLSMSGVDSEGSGDEMTLYLLVALRQYLPYNDAGADDEEETAVVAMAAGVGGYGSDEFHMYEFKVRRCSHNRSHD
jgi:hypothetical protein